DAEHEPVLKDAECQLVRTVIAALERERVGVEDVVDRDLALVIDVRICAPDGLLIQLERDEPRRAPVPLLLKLAHTGNISSSWSAGFRQSAGVPPALRQWRASWLRAQAGPAPRHRDAGWRCVS